jgi:hypothetical protein
VPGVDELVASLSRTSQRELDAAIERLTQPGGVGALADDLVAAFPRVRAWQGRCNILYLLTALARTRPDVRSLAVEATLDRAYAVRMRACSLLAYSLAPEVVPSLERLLSHPHEPTRADAAAAIDAIRSRNHHLWLDREHSGRVLWEVSDRSAVSKDGD